MRLIDADELTNMIKPLCGAFIEDAFMINYHSVLSIIENAPSIDIVRCKECKKSHIDGKTTHYLWCTEWGRSTDMFGYCERGEREGE